MSTRAKLRNLFHRHKDESEPSSPSSPKSSRYDGVATGQSPQRSSRPLSSSDLPPQTEPVRSTSRSRLRRSFDRKSNPVAGEPRRSVDNKRISVDQRQINNGIAPSVPAVPATFKEQNTVRSTNEQDVNMRTSKEKARRSSNSQKPDSPTHVPAPLNFKKASGEHTRRSSTSSSSSSSYADANESTQAAIMRKPVGSDSSRHSQEADARRRSLSSAKQRQRVSMDKPLPSAPQQHSLPVPPHESTLSEDPALSQYLGKERGYLVKDAPVAPKLEGVVDLRNTMDTDVTEHWAPAVTHETVTKQVHHIREENITREIHNHDIYHRILPIVDIEVLPARHFVPAGDGTLLEISESEIPGRSGYKQDWFVAETLSRLPKNATPSNEPRRFTAKQFLGTDGDYKEFVAHGGVPTTETTWVHPPEIEEGGYLTGQTEPFYFGSMNPADDGLRIKAPNGPVIGSSRRHAEQHNRPVTPPTASMKKLSMGN